MARKKSYTRKSSYFFAVVAVMNIVFHSCEHLQQRALILLTNGVSTQLYTHTNLDQIVEYHANITGESVVDFFHPQNNFSFS